MNIVKFLLLIPSTLVIFGYSKTQILYDNPNITNKTIKAQKLEEDKTICELQAYQAFPVNNSYTPNFNSNRQGNFRIRNNTTGTTYSGTYTSRRSSGFLNGYSLGASIARSKKIMNQELNYTICV